MATSDSSGLRFRSYQIQTNPDGSPRELGAGSLGRTFLARHAILGTAVALKIVHEGAGEDEKIRRRFLREAREQARMEHPNIAAITYCDEVDGTMFYVMELCEGGDLRRLIDQRGPLTPAETVHVMLQVGEALHFAHSRGLIHRDLKPSSLLLVFGGDGVPVVKLTDFGLGKSTGGSVDMTTGLLGTAVDRSIAGSPEEARNERLDARSDLFSLGMTAWYLLCGGPPVAGSPAEVLSDRLSPEEYEPRLPPHLTGFPRQIVARLLRKRPEDRYASAAGLLVDLRECAAAMPAPLHDWREPADFNNLPPAPEAKPQKVSSAPAPSAPPEPAAPQVSRTECRRALEDALQAIREAEETTSAIFTRAASEAAEVPDAREPLEMLRHWTDRVPQWRAECQNLVRSEGEVADDALPPRVDRAADLARKAADATGQSRTWAKRVESEVRRAADRRHREDQLHRLQGALDEARNPPPPAVREANPSPGPPPDPPVPPPDDDSDSGVWSHPVAPAAPAAPPNPGRRKALILSAAGVLAIAAAWFSFFRPERGGSGPDNSPPPVVRNDPPPVVDDPDPEPPPPPPPPPQELAATLRFSGPLPTDLSALAIDGLMPVSDPTIDPPNAIRATFRDPEGTAFSVRPPAGFRVDSPGALTLKPEVAIALARTTGAVAWSSPAGTAYTRVSFLWRGPLAGEERVPAAEPVTVSTDVGRAELPTGHWDVRVDDGAAGDDPGAGGAVVEARALAGIELRADRDASIAVPALPGNLEGFAFVTPGTAVLKRSSGDGVADKIREFERSVGSRSRRKWCRIDTWEDSGWRYPSRITAGWAEDGFYVECTDYSAAFGLISSLYSIVRGGELLRVRNFPLADIDPPGSFRDPKASWEAIGAAMATLEKTARSRFPADVRDHREIALEAWKTWTNPRGRGTGPGRLVRLSASGTATISLEIDVQGDIRPVTLTLVPAEGSDTWSLRGGEPGFEEIEASLRPVP